LDEFFEEVLDKMCFVISKNHEKEKESRILKKSRMLGIRITPCATQTP